jgi:hypothetical protein
MCGESVFHFMKDDVVIALQLAVYYSDRPQLYA